jgi:hypothetical protein
MNQYSHPTETIAASDFINNNISGSYLGMKNGNSYYNVNGIVWEAWQSMGLANLNTRHNLTIDSFK